jgi:ABC-type polysaccharide/polyol phosphate transport system ATPase subunit
MARIELDNVGLVFRVRAKSDRTSLKESFIRWMRGQWTAEPMEVHALQGLTLELKAGQRVGVIGHNGAGKSTLLRLLAGVYEPTEGARRVEGRISSLFDLMLGFEAEATGWDNIRYRGYLQGETPSSMSRKAGAIAEFTGLGKFLNMPVRYYSAGMLVRLAFSIATAIEPEVLLVDEVLGAGDAEFQGRARERMAELMSKARLMVCVSHDLEGLKALCNWGVWLEGGRLRMQGPMKKVVAAYLESLHPAAAAAA